QGQEKLSCKLKKENGTHVVLCELGNPMKAGAQVRVCPHTWWPSLTLPCPRSKNSPGSANASVAVMVPVEAQAEMDLRGNSLPATTVLPVNWHMVEGSRRQEDHGIKVEHVYQLHNKGPSTVTGVTLHLAIPNQLGGRVLLYLLELGTEGGISCDDPPGLNPEQV
ncbi:ITA2B protein, partial [Pedionomus torquatus]|nr:ITA2B protein [Pedionomus torquatus]